LNARKNNFGNILDPFKIQNGWFRLELLGFQVLPNPALSRHLRYHIQCTIDQLGLNSFRAKREEDAERYWMRDISLRTLKAESPFVAAELRRQGRLNLGDVW
jgi:hypothetical protein